MNILFFYRVYPNYGGVEVVTSVLAKRFVEEMKRVESLTPEQRKANREKLQAEIAVLDKEWNLTYNALRG